MSPNLRFRVECTVFFIAALALSGSAAHFQWLRTFDYSTYDFLINRILVPLNDDLLIVGIDERSLAEYGAWPWTRSLQARLLEQIGAAQPEAVLLDVVYGGATTPEADRMLADAAGEVGVLALPIIVDALASNRQLIEVLPYPDLLEQADVLGHAHVELDADAIARGAFLHQGIGHAYWPHVAYALAERLGVTMPDRQDCIGDDAFSMQNHRCDFAYVPFAGPPGTVPQVSAADLLDGTALPAAFTGRTVFVGITTAAAPDSITSPVSRLGRPMAGVEFNINLYNALLNDRLIRSGSYALILVIALLCVMPPALLLPRLSPKSMLVAAVGFAGFPLFITVLGLVAFDLRIPLASATMTCLLCYPYWSWRRHEIAWRFVGAEMSRHQSERSRWVPAEPGSLSSSAQALGELLSAEVVWYEAPPAFSNIRQIVIPAPPERWLALSRREPFTVEERQFAARLEATFDAVEVSDRLPGEKLAAQIRKLQNAAEEVRLGREVGLRGLEEMPIGVAVVSALNQVLLINNAWRNAVGTDPVTDATRLDDAVRGLVPPLGQTWLEISRCVLLRGETVTFETKARGSTPVVVEAAPLSDVEEKAESWVITLTDVSDVRIAERQREETLAFLSHDLRSPMLSVLALVRGAPPGELLDEIGRYAQKALSVSEQFLQLSRVQARESFEVYDLDLLAVVENAIDQVFHLARERAAKVVLEHDNEAGNGAWMSGNGEMLERAFVNLLSNAIKYSHTSGRVTVTVFGDDGSWVVEVADQGIGIPDDEQERVFEPYFRSQEPRLAEQRGTGLGLRFVKTVVERHGGTIRLTSRLNEGSRFTVTLPKEQRAQ